MRLQLSVRARRFRSGRTYSSSSVFDSTCFAFASFSSSSFYATITTTTTTTTTTTAGTVFASFTFPSLVLNIRPDGVDVFAIIATSVRISSSSDSI